MNEVTRKLGTTIVYGGDQNSCYQVMLKSLYRSLVECSHGHVVVAAPTEAMRERIRKDLDELRYRRHDNPNDASISREQIFLALDYVTALALIKDDIKRLERLESPSSQRHYYFFDNNDVGFIHRRLLPAMGGRTQMHIRAVISLENPTDRLPTSSPVTNLHNLDT